MSNLVQWANLAVASAQLSQLEALNAQYRQQQGAQRQQAILGDMLFQTERRARQLSVLAGEDPLVAAMFAEEWLGSVQYVSPNYFVAVEHKRDWAASTSRLQSLTQPLADPPTRAFVQQIRALSAEAGQYYRELGNAQNPDAQAAQLQAQHADLVQKGAKAGKLGFGLLGAGCAQVFVIPLIAAIATGIVNASSKKAEVDGGCVGSLVFLLFIAFAVIGGFQIASWSENKTKAKRAEEEMQRFHHALGQLRAFSGDPGRGGVLSRFYAEHPAYTRPLPNVDEMAPLSATQGAPSHTVERQTVVARCRYCRALTPVDAPTCRYCGAGNFA